MSGVSKAEIEAQWLWGTELGEKKPMTMVSVEDAGEQRVGKMLELSREKAVRLLGYACECGQARQEERAAEQDIEETLGWTASGDLFHGVDQGKRWILSVPPDPGVCYLYVVLAT